VNVGDSKSVEYDNCAKIVKGEKVNDKSKAAAARAVFLNNINFKTVSLNN
jgi:hypothetical protein